jgi:periplasmic divalent cation tolerance protein
MSVPSTLLVMTTLPDAEAARSLARRLVEARLAACVNVLAPCLSIYRWRGELQEDGEVPLIIKTHGENYERIENFIRAQHPYELPEVVAIDVARGLPDYLAWVVASAQPEESA